jgi:hypothetical protein
MDLPTVSEVGKTLQQRVLEIHRYDHHSEYLSPVARPQVVKALWHTLEVNSRPGWDGYGASPASAGSHRTACKFIQRLPQEVPDPEVGMDPDGEFSLEWFGTARDHVLSISFGADDRLSFAFRNGVERRKGTTILREQLPAELLAYLKSFGQH